MATLCSCLKYYGRAVITTTRPEDLVIVEDAVRFLSISDHYFSRVNLTNLAVQVAARCTGSHGARVL
jgi:hypothetical protein